MGLLVADVFLPIPSSVIMIGNGALADYGLHLGARLVLPAEFQVGLRSADVADQANAIQRAGPT